MLKEASFILPNADNDGQSLVWLHHKVMDELCDAFNGFTADECFGGWKLNGRVYQENGTRYTVAHHEDDAATFEGIALRAARKAEQKAVYIRRASGEVIIHDLTDAPGPSRLPAQPGTHIRAA